MIKEELITEVRKRDMEIAKLKKEVKKQSDKWYKFYQSRDQRNVRGKKK